MEKKSANINVHITPDEERAIKGLAMAYDKSASEWCREVIVMRLNEERNKAILMCSAFDLHSSARTDSSGG